MEKQIFSLMIGVALGAMSPLYGMEELGEVHSAQGKCGAIKRDIIILAGTSSAGKTTATQELRSKGYNFLINGRDEIVNQVPSYPDFDPLNETPEAWDLKEDEYYLNHLGRWVWNNQHEPIILDVLTPQSIIKPLEESGFSAQPFKVLLYVPLSKYRERICARNKTALKENKLIELRNPLDMALQYQEIFGLSSQDTNPPLGMKINYEGMQKILNDFSQDTVKFLKSIPGEGCSEEIENEAERQSDIKMTLNKMFLSMSEGYLVPKEEYDLIIDTSIYSPNDVSERVQKRFLERK